MIRMDFPPLQVLLTAVQNDPAIMAMILYGSYVRGENYRDIDVCLIPFPYQGEMPLDQVLQYKGGFASILDVNFFPDLPLYIQYEVIKEGHLLLNKDYDLVCDIYVDTLRRYTDFLPHFKIFLEVE